MKNTQDLHQIETWITERKGRPAKVRGTEDLLRVKFDSMDDDLEPITWAKFFETIQSKDLKFLYEDAPDSRFCKFVFKEDLS